MPASHPKNRAGSGRNPVFKTRWSSYYVRAYAARPLYLKSLERANTMEPSWSIEDVRAYENGFRDGQEYIATFVKSFRRRVVFAQCK